MTSETPTEVASVETPVEPVHVEVLQFEGANVVDHEGIIPRTVVECSEPYKRGTILRLAVELRVQNVAYEETGKDGDLVRRVKFGINDVTVVTAFDPATIRENVGGSASGAVLDVDPADVEALAALGMDFSSTAETWPGVGQSSQQSSQHSSSQPSQPFAPASPGD